MTPDLQPAPHLREERLRSEEIYRGRILDVYKDTVLLENGTEAIREVVHHPGGACVVPLTSDGCVLMVRQFRYPHHTETLEVPAGKLEYGEDPLQCAVRELEARLADGPLEISLSMYSTFEQVGALGFSLSAQDECITTQPGDIMLYNGDQIVLFYGENTWAYTSLGRMDLTNESLEELLGDHNVTITLRLG